MKKKIAFATLITAAATAWAAAPAGRETFTAFGVNLGSSIRPTATSHVTITIDRWSTDDERRRLVSAFTEGGPDAFLKELQKIKPLGRLFTPDSIGYDLKYAHQVPMPTGGRRILIATDRPLGYWEQVNRPRSVDYPFTFIEMRLDAKGKGEGKMTLATKVNAFGDTIELENYDLTPVQLSSIQASKK
jgi:hypothetical protein